MRLNKQTKSLLYFDLHFLAALICCWLLGYYDFFETWEERFYMGILFATPFAVGGYVGIVNLIESYNQWQYRRGRDVCREDAHVDDAGFIHIIQASARRNQDE